MQEVNPKVPPPPNEVTTPPNEVTPPHKSFFWIGILALALIVGALFVWACPSSLSFLACVSARIRSDAGGRFLGIILLSAVIGHIVIYGALWGLQKLFDIGPSELGVDRWPPTILGTLEGFLYVIALVMAKPDFIAFWVAVKTAGGWLAWSGTPDHKLKDLNKGRRRFYAFLVGNALAIIAAVVTFGALKLFTFKP